MGSGQYRGAQKRFKLIIQIYRSHVDYADHDDHAEHDDHAGHADHADICQDMEDERELAAAKIQAGFKV